MNFDCYSLLEICYFTLPPTREPLQTNMPDLVRQEIAASASTIVVKVGTRVVTGDDGKLDLDRIARLTESLNTIIESGRRVVLVSSGAVGAGMSQLGLDVRPKGLAQLQAVAAIGQTNLIEAYDRTMRKHGRHAAQVLLTAEDLEHRAQYLNVRNTLHSLLDYGALPVINENDTVAVEELQTTFGDNDRLAALVTNLLHAPLLVILSDIDGLYDGDPSAKESRLLSTVTRLDETILGYVRDKATGLSKGGMASKLEAARITTAVGENVIIASGHKIDTLEQVMAGEPVGTLFLAQGKLVSPLKRWIGFTTKTKGTLTLDDGARRAVCDQGSSLLAVGIRKADGNFGKGDAVSLRDLSGKEIARGLTNYTAEEIQRIQGMRSEQIAETLGHCPYQEVVHRDNMALV